MRAPSGVKNLIAMPDKYRSFRQLARAEVENLDFRVNSLPRAAETVLIAPHGGEIEPGTSEIAAGIAGNDYSLYLFDGLKPEENGALHITSTRFDEPRCMELVEESERVVAIHGEGSPRDVAYIGGRDAALAARIAKALKAHGFSVRRHRNELLQGVSERNICNRGRSGAGVQLELGRGLRKRMFASLDAAGRRSTTPVFERFIGAVREGLAEHTT